MNPAVSKQASVFRGRSAARYLTAWLAVLVQLHIFLVLELHHHVLSQAFLRSTVASGADWGKPSPARVPSPLCPACQVARQGAVQAGVERLAWLPLGAVALTPPAAVFNILVVFLLQSSGRDPPRV